MPVEVTQTLTESWPLIAGSVVAITTLLLIKQPRKAAGTACVLVGTLLTSLGAKLGAELPKGGAK